MNKKNILIFVAGLITGGAAGVFATRDYFRKKYQEIADDEIADMQEYYQQELDRMVEYAEDDVADGELEEESPEEEADTSDNDGEPIYQTDYAHAYQKQNDFAEEDDSMEALAAAATEEHQKNKDRPPRLISEEAVGELSPHIDHQILFYYTLDDTVTDEEDKIIDDPAWLLGDTLDKYNFRESDEKLVFVLNYALDTVYEIQKVNGSFEED